MSGREEQPDTREEVTPIMPATKTTSKTTSTRRRKTTSTRSQQARGPRKLPPHIEALGALKKADAATYLGISQDLLTKLMYRADDPVPAFNAGACLLFRRAGLDAWMERQEAARSDKVGISLSA